MKTYDVSWEITEAIVHEAISTLVTMNLVEDAYIVRRMLMSRSQLQPAIKATAAGGKTMAT